MPALAAFIGSLFTSLLTFFGLYLTKKVLVIAAVIAVLTASVVAFSLTIQGLLDSLNVSYPTGPVAVGLSLLPSNTNTCVSVIVSTHVAVWAHNWFIKIVSARNV